MSNTTIAAMNIAAPASIPATSTVANSTATPIATTPIESITVADSFATQLSSRDRMWLASDLLPPFDFIAFLVAGYATSLLLSLVGVTTIVSSANGVAWLDRSNLSLIGASLATFILYDENFASLSTLRRPLSLLRSFAMRFSITLLLIALLGDATHLLESTSTAWLAVWLTTSFALTGCARWFVSQRVQLMQSKGSLKEAIAVVGAGPIADGLDRHLRQSKALNVDLVGIFDDVSAGGENQSASTTWPVHQLDQLIELSKSRRLDWILITVPEADEERIRSIVARLKSLSVPIALCPQNISQRIPIQAIDFAGTGLPVVLLSDRPIKKWNAILKAAEDIVLSWVITFMLLPVFALIALAIRLDSPGPIVFKQRRHTFNNTEFDIYKFRTMRWQPKGADGELKQTQRNDQRITRVGRFLRETSLDELPQLFNVLRGEMSLIGPRPHAVNMKTEDRLGWEITDRYVHRHRVKPGMTGWSQVNGARGATDTVQQLKRRIDLDLYYVDHWSLWLDLKILLMTFKVVLKRTNAF